MNGKLHKLLLCPFSNPLHTASPIDHVKPHKQAAWGEVETDRVVYSCGVIGGLLNGNSSRLDLIRQMDFSS